MARFQRKVQKEMSRLAPLVAILERVQIHWQTIINICTSYSFFFFQIITYLFGTKITKK